MLRTCVEYATQEGEYATQEGEYATQAENMLRTSVEYATQAENMLRKNRQVTFSLKDCRANIG